RRMSDTLISPRNLVDTIPPFVSAALTRALRMVGTERIQTVPELFDALTEPMKQESTFQFSERQKRYLLLAFAGLALIAVLSIAIILVGRKKPVPVTTSSTKPDTSTSEVVSAAPVTVAVPSFVNQDYTVIQQNPEYMNNFLFSITEEFSSDFAAGKVTDQEPAAGSSIEPGSIIKLTVSRGAETVLMPTVVGYARVDAKAMLDAAGIGYIVLERANDGTYTQDYVVDCDVPAGTAIDPAQTKVTLFVAQAPATA
ncbi:MAG: PASTA domain-containing protein, partial [Ruthenibacterium sp.]